MTKQTKTILIVAGVAAVGYYLWKQSSEKKNFITRRRLVRPAFGRGTVGRNTGKTGVAANKMVITRIDGTNVGTVYKCETSNRVYFSKDSDCRRDMSN